MTNVKLSRLTTGLCSISVLLLLSTAANAGWRLYDNFNASNAVNPKKWSLNPRAANISVENGKLKFETQAGVVNTSSHAVLLKWRNRIRGIRVDVLIKKTASCSGDVRGRISGYVGNKRDNKTRLWHQLMARAGQKPGETGQESISAGSGYEPFDFSDFEDLYFLTIQNTQVTGKKIRLETRWTRKTITYKANKADGNVIYRFKKAVRPLNTLNLGKFRVALGTRAGDKFGSPGSCEILFDNVWVFIP